MLGLYGDDGKQNGNYYLGCRGSGIGFRGSGLESMGSGVKVKGLRG